MAIVRERGEREARGRDRRPARRPLRSPGEQTVVVESRLVEGEMEI